MDRDVTTPAEDATERARFDRLVLAVQVERDHARAAGLVVAYADVPRYVDLSEALRDMAEAMHAVADALDQTPDDRDDGGADDLPY